MTGWLNIMCWMNSWADSSVVDVDIHGYLVFWLIDWECLQIQSDSHFCITMWLWPCWQVYGYLAFWSTDSVTGSVCRPEWWPHLYHHLYVTLLTDVWLPGLLVNWECLQTRMMATSVPPSVYDLVVDRCMVTWPSGWRTGSACGPRVNMTTASPSSSSCCSLSTTSPPLSTSPSSRAGQGALSVFRLFGFRVELLRCLRRLLQGQVTGLCQYLG